MRPAVCVKGKAADKAPVLMVSYDGRVNGLRMASPYLENGHTVVIADVSGVGEIGREQHIFYGAKDRPDEGLGAMCYLLGEPLAGRRATDRLVLAETMTATFGRKPLRVAVGPLAIPAAHAYAANASAWEGVEFADKPEPWFDVLSAGSKSTTKLRYADLVPGAAMGYDWTELVK